MPARRKGDPKLVKTFDKLIGDGLEKKLDLQALHDQYAEALHDLAAKKAKQGKDVIEGALLEDDDPEAAATAQVSDLMKLLRTSLGAGNTKASVAREEAKPADPERAVPAKRVLAREGATASSLSDKPKAELYEMATRLKVPGRSKMDKSDLVKAIAKAKPR